MKIENHQVFSNGYFRVNSNLQITDFRSKKNNSFVNIFRLQRTTWSPTGTDVIDENQNDDNKTRFTKVLPKGKHTQHQVVFHKKGSSWKVPSIEIKNIYLWY